MIRGWKDLKPAAVFFAPVRRLRTSPALAPGSVGSRAESGVPGSLRTRGWAGAESLRLAPSCGTEPLGARGEEPLGDCVRPPAPLAPTPSAPIAFPTVRKSRGRVARALGGGRARHCRLKSAGAPSRLRAVLSRTLQPPAGQRAPHTDVTGTLGSLQAAPGLMIVQKVAIKGAWEAGWRREQQKPNSADPGTERATGRSCGQRLRVLATGACSRPPWRPKATAITAL